MSTTTDVTIPYTQYRSLYENTAAHFGEISARSLNGFGHSLIAGYPIPGRLHPGDNIGRLLCQVWTVRPDSTGLALAAYMVALNRECDRQEVARPGFDAVVRGLPLAINENEFPGVDVAQLIATVRREVPEYYSDHS